MVVMRSKYYTLESHVEDGDNSSSPGQTSTSTPPSFEPLHIEKPNPYMIICLPHKGMLRKPAFNPHVRAT